jgi:hypothetical protein
MSETYQSKRERWQRMLEALPVGLREHISLRNVEAVAGLTPQAQERLAEAIQAGLKRIPRAMEQLRERPNTSVAELLDPPVAAGESPLPESDIPEYVRRELTELIQLCFPDMPHVSAEALTTSDVMEVVRHAAQAQKHLLTARTIKTDFVMMIAYGLMRQSLERLEKIIADTPALRQAFDQSPMPWKPNDWRR